MRILFIAWRDLANELAGGSEVLVDHLAAGLTERGHDVALLCANPIGAPRAYRVQPNGGTVDQYLRAPMAYLRHFRDADLVIDVANGLSFYTPLWRRGPSVCFVNHIHTDQWDQWFPTPVATAGRLLERRAMPAAYKHRLFVAVSPSTAAGLVELGVDRDDIRIIINGTSMPDQPGIESAEPLFVGLGRLVPHKRFDLAIKAFAAIQPEIGGRLVIAGQGPELERLRAMAGPHTVLPGKISEDAKADLLSSAWLMVHPASHEGWGLVITEAAAYGTPSLAFRVPGLRDSIVDGMSGILVDEPDELASTWKRIAEDPDLRAHLRAGAMRRAAACTWERTTDRFEEICQEAVERQPRSRRVPRSTWTGEAASPTVDPAQVGPEFAGLPIGTGRPAFNLVRDRPDLSIVLPAYNESARLPVSLPTLLDHVRTRADRTEVILVDDGSSDDTVEVARRHLDGLPRAGVLKLERHVGKGGAVRAGVARASGDQIVFMDADMATDLSSLDPLLGALDHVHVAIGSRSAPGAVTNGVTPSSDAAHRAFNQLARSSTGLGILDFQCGFKAFRGEVGKLLFHLIHERGYAFDVELLAVAHRIGYEIREVPVRWQAVRGSHMRIVADSAMMACQVTRIGRGSRSKAPMSAIEAYGRDPGTDPDHVIKLVADHLRLPAPVVAWNHGAMVLLPFIEPADARRLADGLASEEPQLILRAMTLDATQIFGATTHGLRRALVEA